MPKQKLLSIIIPTKDRYFYLIQLIQFIDGFDLEEIELIVQDNTFDNREVVSFLGLKHRAFLKYFHVQDQLPISLNIDLAIKEATGEYICLIGDDDGVLPNIVDCVRWMKSKNIEALRPAITIYNWPDYLNFGKPEQSAALLHDQFSFEVKEVNLQDSLQELANKGFRHIYNIPKVYQGIVKRSCLDEVYKVGGTFCPGPSPDMATAVALCFVVKKFVIINQPVILIGQSQHVGGGERKLKGAVKNIDDILALPKDAKQNWDKRIPKVWCSQTVWPESAIKAIQYMKKEDQVKINYEFIQVWFIQTHPAETALAFKLDGNKIRLATYFIYYKFIAPVLYRFSYFKRRHKKVKLVEGRENLVPKIQNIKEASDYLINNHSQFISFNN